VSGLLTRRNAPCSRRSSETGPEPTAEPSVSDGLRAAKATSTAMVRMAVIAVTAVRLSWPGPPGAELKVTRKPRESSTGVSNRSTAAGPFLSGLNGTVRNVGATGQLWGLPR
jgi:hypothetical protein